MASEAVKVTAVGNLQVSVNGSPPSTVEPHAARALGDFVRLKGQETNGRTIYKKLDDDAMLWFAGGAWWIGPPAMLGMQSGLWRCADAARIPENCRSAWEGAAGGSSSAPRFVEAPHVRCCEYLMPRLLLIGATPEDRHQDKLGTYVLTNELVNDRPCYQQLGNPSRMIWFLTPYWYVGKSAERGLGQGWVQVRSLAHVPEQIFGTWAIWNSTDKAWVDAPDVRIHADAQARAVAERLSSEPLPIHAAISTSGAPSAAAASALDGIDGRHLELPLADALLADAVPGISLDGASASAEPVSAEPAVAVGGRLDVYLSHDWTGVDAEGRSLREHVECVHEYLRARGLTTSYDQVALHGNVTEGICGAIDDAETVVVLVSQGYMDKVSGKMGRLDQCKTEFEYAERTKGAEKLISAVLEPTVRDTKRWRGSVGMVLGSRPFVDLSKGCEGEWERGAHRLYQDIIRLKGLKVADDALEGEPLANQAGYGFSGALADLSGMTMLQKVDKVKEQLGLDPKLNVARGVAEANTCMGIEPTGTLHTQVERLLTELGIQD